MSRPAMHCLDHLPHRINPARVMIRTWVGCVTYCHYSVHAEVDTGPNSYPPTALVRRAWEELPRLGRPGTAQGVVTDTVKLYVWVCVWMCVCTCVGVGVRV